MVGGGFAGGVLGLLHAVMTIGLQVNQIVMGLTLTILGTGLSSYIGTSYGNEPFKEHLSKIDIPLLSKIPWIGEIFFQQDIMVYIAIVTVIVAALIINRTRQGLALRGVGEAPAAADAAGVPVFAVRYVAVWLGGVLAGIGGAYLSVVYTQSWSNELTAGRGWIAIALVIFASWRPLLLLPGRAALRLHRSAELPAAGEGRVDPQPVPVDDALRLHPGRPGDRLDPPARAQRLGHAGIARNRL